MSQSPQKTITNTWSNDVSQHPDRRAEDRMKTLFRVARVICAGDEGLARITNMSDRGAGLRTEIQVNLSDILIVELVEGVELCGHVVWTKDKEFGLQFDQPISSTDLLAALAVGAQVGITRAVRLPVATTAVTHCANGLRNLRVIDISQRGLKLMNDGSLIKDLDMKVTLPGGLTAQGTVRWTRGDHAGVMLLEPFSVEALGSARALLGSAQTNTPSAPKGKELPPT
ncbi:PilZ domain-containing protein [Erythrobacter sp. R86502]|uniref:PilZ domain-containing protein n=1 Tax=Erythrobacter sp. R86502 TaxID=3093846 RepID=UPI0036D2ACFF